MPLAEGVSARIALKKYASALIDPTAAAVSATDLDGSTGGQILRRVSSTLTLNKDTYQSNEIRADRQIADFRHGVKRASGNISGELSPLTYADLFESAMRGTWAAAVSASESDFTSVAADNATSKFTFASGNPITKGFRVGMVVRATNLSAAGNNGKNFLILGFGGTSGREVTVFPAPDTMSADTAFTFASVGKSLIIPASGHVSRKWGVEIWNQDIDVAQLFTEMRNGPFNVQLPASGMATVDFDFLGRGMEMYEDSDAPFFQSPAAETTTGIEAAVNGLLRVAGQTVAVITGMNIQHQAALTGDPVVGSNLLPEIFVGRHAVSGQLTANFADADLINDFVAESEIEILVYLASTSAVNSPAMTFYMPRVKLGGASLATQGEAGQIITLPFTALRSTATEASTGIASTTLQIVDTEIAP